MPLLQTVCGVCQLKNFKNRPIIGKDIDKKVKCHVFMAHDVEIRFEKSMTACEQVEARRFKQQQKKLAWNATCA